MNPILFPYLSINKYPKPYLIMNMCVIADT